MVGETVVSLVGRIVVAFVDNGVVAVVAIVSVVLLLELF